MNENKEEFRPEISWYDSSWWKKRYKMNGFIRCFYVTGIGSRCADTFKIAKKNESFFSTVLKCTERWLQLGVFSQLFYVSHVNLIGKRSEIQCSRKCFCFTFYVRFMHRGRCEVFSTRFKFINLSLKYVVHLLPRLYFTVCNHRVISGRLLVVNYLFSSILPCKLLNERYCVVKPASVKPLYNAMSSLAGWYRPIRM